MKNFFELLNDELMAGRDVTMVSVTASSVSYTHLDVYKRQPV